MSDPEQKPNTHHKWATITLIFTIHEHFLGIFLWELQGQRSHSPQTSLHHCSIPDVQGLIYLTVHCSLTRLHSETETGLMAAISRRSAGVSPPPHTHTRAAATNLSKHIVAVASWVEEGGGREHLLITPRWGRQAWFHWLSKRVLVGLDQRRGYRAEEAELFELKALLIRPFQMSLNVTQLAGFKRP